MCVLYSQLFSFGEASLPKPRSTGHTAFGSHQERDLRYISHGVHHSEYYRGPAGPFKHANKQLSLPELPTR